MILADKIILQRKKNGWSQEELAEQIGVSRQSVSKWESAQSVPDLNKILLLSQAFGVTTDYLLKDDIEEAEYLPCDTPDLSLEPPVRYVSMEEAQEFLSIKEKTAGKVALATLLCILSPVCLISLAAYAETAASVLSENAASGIGLITLFMMIAGAVALFISCGMKTSKFEYLEKEIIETEYGVSGMVKERQRQYQGTYTRHLILGTCLCILSVVPLFGALILTENDFIMALMVSVLLIMIGLGVVCFIVSGIHWESMQQLLQEGDYTLEKKMQNSFMAPIATIYWLLAVAVYLAISFTLDNWDRSWIIWPIAAVLYAVVSTICTLIRKSK